MHQCVVHASFHRSNTTFVDEQFHLFSFVHVMQFTVWLPVPTFHHFSYDRNANVNYAVFVAFVVLLVQSSVRIGCTLHNPRCVIGKSIFPCLFDRYDSSGLHEIIGKSAIAYSREFEV